jgi:RNA polymerase sigma factor (TIGR02999 family)
MSERSDVTRLLGELRDGRREALEDLFPLLYDSMRAMALKRMGPMGRGRTLDATGLVHEAYLRLVDQTRFTWNDRNHFLAACSVVMRNLVIDFARKRQTQRRGGSAVALTFDEESFALDDQADELLALDEALQKLEELEPRLCRMVECRFFAGLTEEETGQALGVTSRTVRRDWVKAKGLLHHLLEG